MTTAADTDDAVTMARVGLRAVIADDELLLREGVARLLEEAGIEVVGQAGDAPDLLTDADDGETGGNERDDVKSDVENLNGSAFDDVLTGDGHMNLVAGEDGNDTIKSGGGADMVSGDAGDDVVDGGAGRE